MLCFAVRRLLFCDIGGDIFVGTAFNLSFFMIRVLLRSLTCNGILIADYNQWWVIAVILVKILQCAVG